MAQTSSQPSISVPPHQASSIHCDRCHRILIIPPCVRVLICPSCRSSYHITPHRKLVGNPLSIPDRSQHVGPTQSQVCEVDNNVDIKPPKMLGIHKETIFVLNDLSLLSELEALEDCFILDYEAYLPFTLQPEEVALRDYPHPRHLCATYSFDNKSNYIHCKMCYCYVCDEPAPCKQWTKESSFFKHCEATPDLQIWKDLRNATKKKYYQTFDQILSYQTVMSDQNTP